MPTQKPFNKGKLRTRNGDLTKKWYVEYYIFNTSVNKLERKRYYGNLQNFNTIAERTELGLNMVEEVNEKLKAGKYNNEGIFKSERKYINEKSQLKAEIKELKIKIKETKSIVRQKDKRIKELEIRLNISLRNKLKQ